MSNRKDFTVDGLTALSETLERSHKGYIISRPSTEYPLFKIHNGDRSPHPELDGSYTNPELAIQVLDKWLLANDPELAQVAEPTPEESERIEVADSVRELEGARTGEWDYLGKKIKRTETNLFTVVDPELGGAHYTSKDLAEQQIENAALKKLYTRDEVLALTTFSLSTLVREEAAGRFPSALHLGRRRVAYDKSAVDAWLKEKLDRSKEIHQDPIIVRSFRDDLHGNTFYEVGNKRGTFLVRRFKPDNSVLGIFNLDGSDHSELTGPAFVSVEQAKASIAEYLSAHSYE